MEHDKQTILEQAFSEIENGKVRVPGLSPKKDKTIAGGAGANRYRPVRADGPYDGYDSGSDLLIGMMRENGTSDAHFETGGFGLPSYVTWAMKDAAKESGVRVENNSEVMSHEEQMKFLMELADKLEKKKSRTERDHELMNAARDYVAFRTGT